MFNHYQISRDAKRQRVCKCTLDRAWLGRLQLWAWRTYCRCDASIYLDTYRSAAVRPRAIVPGPRQ